MRVLVYAGNLRKGGGLQAGVRLVEEIRSHQGGGAEWLIAVGPQLACQIESVSVEERKYLNLVQLPPPGRSSVFRTHAAMSRIERDFDPSVTYSVFGPPMWFPKASHVCGFAKGWMLFPESIAWTHMPARERIVRKLGNEIRFGFMPPSWTYVVETELAAERLRALKKYRETRVTSVGNTFSVAFSDKMYEPRTAPHHPFVFLAISANYRHKNLGALVRVASLLKSRGHVDFQIHFTLPDRAFEEIVEGSPDASDVLVNRGVVTAAELPRIFETVDALLLPTLLEISTASYPEAMAAGIPIVTSNLDFARQACGDAAVYFDPLDDASIADQCAHLMNEPTLYRDVASKSKERLSTYPTHSEQFSAVMSVLQESSA